MQTKFEHFAATSMLGSKDSPPRDNGTLKFDREWEGRAFGIALALSKQGQFEWEDFRQELMRSIADWESDHATDDPSWDYYQRWLIALERLVLRTDILATDALEAKTRELTEGITACTSKSESS